MAKLAPMSGRVARALIAGLLAWVLAIQGLTAAASPHAGAMPAGLDLCAPDTNGEQHPPGHHDPCPCCILCPSCHLGGLAWMPVIPPTSAGFPLPRTAGISSRRLLATEPAPPPGWTSSWSQRAPPHFS